MKILKQLLKTALILCVLGSLAFVTPQSRPVQAADTVTYNLFATDTFVRLADGTILYNYGFVGGRAGVPDVQFQQSVGADGVNFGNTTLKDGWPTPSAGPVTEAEQPLQGNAQFPAPLIYAKVGDVVQINFKNLGTTNPTAPNDPHSIHLHGLDVNAANDGVPETSIGAIPANGTTDAGVPLPGAGNVIVYMFTPKNAGTYMYHCHQEADIHVNMGMYGALVIYNQTDPAGNTGPGSNAGGVEYGFQYDKDYVLLLSELDPDGHVSERDSTDYNWAEYNPNYWFINGLNFPQTIHAGFPEGYSWSDWIAAHPGYDPFITGSVSNMNGYWKTRGDKVLLRMINMGFEAQPMHMHAFHGKVLATDERPITWGNTPKVGRSNPTPFGQGFEKQTLLIGSGETYDWLIDFGQQSLFGTYNPGTYTRYQNGSPILNTDTSAPAITFNGDPETTDTYIGGPQVGPGDGDPNSLVAKDLTGGPIPGQLFPFHNHDDYKATNNGIYPGGMFTMIMTLP